MLLDGRQPAGNSVILLHEIVVVLILLIVIGIVVELFPTRKEQVAVTEMSDCIDNLKC